MNTILTKYHIDKEINHGSFGKIYSGTNKISEDRVAIKIETRENSLIKNEAIMYQLMGKIKGIPKFRMYLTDTRYSYLVLDLLGESLKTYKERICDNVQMENVINIGIQLTKILQEIHKMGIVHRDIKPQNIVFDKDCKNIFLIDFGFSKKIIVESGVKTSHIKKKQISNIIGSPNFISINVHKLIEPSRRDDIESMIYVLLYLTMDILPWAEASNENTRILKENLIYNSTYNSTYNKTYINILIYIKTLQFEEQPDYNYIISMIK